MTERPGRKALFSGAVTPAPAPEPSGSTEEIAAHVRQLNEEIASRLSSAVAGREVTPLDAVKFGTEYSTLISAVNAAFEKLSADRIPPAPQPAFVPLPLVMPRPEAPAPSFREETARYETIISELKRSLETMVDRNPVPMLVTTPSFVITDANDAFVQMSGLKKEDLANTSLGKFRLISQTGEGAKVALTQKRRSFGEVTIELPSGVHILEQYSIPMTADDGSVSALLFVYTDVTSQRKKNNEIEQLRHRSEIIVQQNPMPILLVDTAFNVRVVNEAYVTLSGIKRTDLQKMNLHDFKILEQTGEGLKRVISDRQRSKGDVLVEFPSGIRRLQQYGIPIEDASGKISSILIVYNDITDERRKLDEINSLVANQQKSQQDLQKKMDEVATLKQRSDIIVKQNPMPIMLMDTSFKIFMANEAYTNLTGLSMDRLIGMNAKDFRISSQRGEGLKKVLTEKKRSFGEVVIQFPSGVRTLEQYGIPILDAKGDISSLLCVYNDVTQQREQEAKIKEMMDAARSNAELLSVSAEELQTALAQIAAGDLTYRVSIDEADPLVKLKIDYNTAAESIFNVLRSLADAVARLDVTINDTIKSTDEIAKATEQVAVSSQKSADNAKMQIGSIHKISNDVSEISASIEQIASTSHDVMTHAEKATLEGAEAAGIGKLATGKMQNVEKISKQSVDEIVALNDQMREISKIVNLIADIANQTNLLALNAAIEAARAGDAGRGFAVVAAEVKTLANESKRSAEQIEEMINNLKGEAMTAAMAMEETQAVVGRGSVAVTDTLSAFTRIAADIEKVAASASDVATATGEQATLTEKITDSVNEIAGRIRATAGEAEESAASTEELSAAIGEISRMIEQVNTIALSALEANRKFRV